MEMIYASSPEVQAALQDVMDTEIAHQRRRELSDLSFKEWLYNILRVTFARLGYQLQNFGEFWIDMGEAIASGFADGRRQAHEEAELRRKSRERRYY